MDTNILVYAHDQSALEDDRQVRAALLLRRLLMDGTLAISTQVLIEFYSAATRKLGLSSLAAEGILADFGAVTIHRPSYPNLIHAARLHRESKVAWWDALILTSALELGCSVLWTEDLSHNQRFGPLIVKNPFKM
ncbi:MAG: PIN domain-containing protein [Acidobacteriota bacterium]